MAIWQNEPAGATVLTDHDFSTVLTTGWNRIWPSGQIVSDATAPLSPNLVYQDTWQNHSFSDIANPYYTFPSGLNQFYLGVYWKPSSPFYGWSNVSTQKLWLIEPTHTYFSMWRTGGGGASSTYTIVCTPASGNNNCHIASGASCDILFPNVSSTTVPLGTWILLEFVFQCSTGINARNGKAMWWMNGTLMGNYQTLNTNATSLQTVMLTHVWDAVDPQPVTDTHRHDHVRISRGGTISGGGGGGGGGGEPPPPPPPPPPVALSSLTPVNASIAAAGTQQYTVMMTATAPAPIVVTTASSNPGVATVPASVTVNSGQSTALFTATAVATGSTTISATYNSVQRTASLQVQANPGGGGGGGATTYDYSVQFSGTQGSNNWYYLEENGTQMTYDSGAQVWRGTQTSFLQTIWQNGFHPGFNAGTKLRWVAPSNGEVQITGAAYDIQVQAGSTGCTFRIQKNGTTLFTRVIADGDTTGGNYDVTTEVSTGDFIDFLLTSGPDYSFNSTNLDPVIEFTADSGGGGEDPDPPPPPPPPISVVDFFADSTTIIKNTAFTMTVRLSASVTTDTVVVIQVGSASLVTAPSSVTVASGASEKSFSVTPLAVGLVAIDAVLNGTKRVNLFIQDEAVEEPTEPEGPGGPARVTDVLAYPDGATVSVEGPIRAVAFAYDAQPDFMTIPRADRPATATDQAGTILTTLQHGFTWPSGTTTVQYKVQGTDETWSEAMAAPLIHPPAPPLPPPALLAVMDADGVEWQLRGLTAPYALYRNRVPVAGAYGLALRLNGDGTMELLRVPAMWQRRDGETWVEVT
jgi:hypothetical protein